MKTHFKPKSTPALNTSETQTTLWCCFWNCYIWQRNHYQIDHLWILCSCGHPCLRAGGRVRPKLCNGHFSVPPKLPFTHPKMPIARGGLEKQSSWKTFPIWWNPISNRNAARMDFNSTDVKTPFWSPREIESCPRPMRNSRRKSFQLSALCIQHVFNISDSSLGVLQFVCMWCLLNCLMLMCWCMHVFHVFGLATYIDYSLAFATLFT